MTQPAFRMGRSDFRFPQNFPGQPCQRNPRQSLGRNPFASILGGRSHSPHPHRVVRHRDRMSEREVGIGIVTAFCFWVAQRFQRCDLACPIGPGFSPCGNLRQLPHPRHQPRVLRTLHQKHLAIAAMPKRNGSPASSAAPALPIPPAPRASHTTPPPDKSGTPAPAACTPSLPIPSSPD